MEQDVEEVSKFLRKAHYEYVSAKPKLVKDIHRAIYHYKDCIRYCLRSLACGLDIPFDSDTEDLELCNRIATIFKSPENLLLKTRIEHFQDIADTVHIRPSQTDFIELRETLDRACLDILVFVDGLHRDQGIMYIEEYTATIGARPLMSSNVFVPFKEIHAEVSGSIVEMPSTSSISGMSLILDGVHPRYSIEINDTEHTYRKIIKLLDDGFAKEYLDVRFYSSKSFSIYVGNVTASNLRLVTEDDGFLAQTANGLYSAEILNGLLKGWVVELWNPPNGGSVLRLPAGSPEARKLCSDNSVILKLHAIAIRLSVDGSNFNINLEKLEEIQ